MTQAMSSQDRYASMIAGLQESGLSRTEIARAIGLSRSTVWRAATGMWREPDHQSVVKLDRLYQNRIAVSPHEQDWR